MELDNYLAYVAISFFTIISPGAAILLAINNGIAFGTKAVYLSTIGNAIGLFILSCIAMFAVGSLITLSTYFFLILKIIGAIYLIYLGIKQIVTKDFSFQAKKKNKNHLDAYKTFQKGFLVAITNPKPILFFGAIFPLFLEPNNSLIEQFFIMTLTFIAISFCSLILYGSLATSLRKWFFDIKKLRIFYKVSGSLFILIGISMLFLEKKS